jgi:hypothetical protein
LHQYYVRLLRRALRRRGIAGVNYCHALTLHGTILNAINFCLYRKKGRHTLLLAARRFEVLFLVRF